jgi:hypothetical protein
MMRLLRFCSGLGGAPPVAFVAALREALLGALHPDRFECEHFRDLLELLGSVAHGSAKLGSWLT